MNGLDLIIIMALLSCALVGQAGFRRALRAQKRKPVTGDDLTRAIRESYDNLPYNLQRIRGGSRAA